jgi:hypothetical protein
VSLVMLAFVMMAVARQRANCLTSLQKEATKPSCSAGALDCPGNPPRPRFHQRQIEPVVVIAWSAWRGAHQATAQASHRKRKVQLT